MVAGEDEASEKSRLEVFDGAHPEKYRMWKRRAQLMLASLPTTITEKKHGPKLMSYIAGEAEVLLEGIEVAKICSEDGAKAIWEVLDEKYGPQQIDLLQEAMKTYFHELHVKNGESFRQFHVRYDAARRKLEDLEVKLPPVVLGFMFLKKLRLDSAAESMVLTATSGDLTYDKVIKAVKAVFPDGKGTNVGKSSKDHSRDAFQAEDESAEGDLDEEQSALEIMVSDLQEKDDYEDEDILDAYESYTEVRRRMQEQKKSRGFYPRQPEKPRTGYQITGSIRGRIEAMKSRTRCHNCRQFGHWKKECPARNKGSASSASSSSKNDKKEVLLVEQDEATKKLWEAFYVTEEEADKTFPWGAGLPNDCRNSGNADTHSTGNRQREGDAFPVVQMSVRRPEREGSVVGPHDAHVSDQFLHDSSLTTCGVPDTACRKTLVGKETLHRIEAQLLKRGMKVKRAKVSNEFRFGNAGTLQSHEVAMIPGHIAGKRIVVKAAVLPGSGAETPLLLSKEFLRQLGTVMNLGEDQAVFPKLGVKVKMLETLRGHYALPLFDFSGVSAAADCWVAEGRNNNERNNKHMYDIDKLESVGSSNLDEQNPDSFSDHCYHGIPLQAEDQSISGSSPFEQRSSVSTDSADARAVGRATESGGECGRGARHATRFSRSTNPAKHTTTPREVRPDRDDPGADLSPRQGVLSVGPRPHQRSEELRGHETSRVYIAFVDQNKQNRLEITQNHQMPVAKPQVKKRATRGRVRGHQHLEETDMEWEIAEVIHGVDMAHRWGDLTGRLVEHEENKHQTRFQRILEHPQGANMLNQYLRG